MTIINHQCERCVYWGTACEAINQCFHSEMNRLTTFANFYCKYFKESSDKKAFAIECGYCSSKIYINAEGYLSYSGSIVFKLDSNTGMPQLTCGCRNNE